MFTIVIDLIISFHFPFHINWSLMFPFLSADPISVTCGGKMSRIEVYRTFLRIPPTICENGKNEKRKFQMIEKESVTWNSELKLKNWKNSLLCVKSVERSYVPTCHRLIGGIWRTYLFSNRTPSRISRMHLLVLRTNTDVHLLIAQEVEVVIRMLL